MKDINKTMQELAEYIRLQEELQANIEILKDEIKQHMDMQGIDTLQGVEHKATYKVVKSSRIDITALKKQDPDTYNKYTKTTETRRFVFA